MRKVIAIFVLMLFIVACSGSSKLPGMGENCYLTQECLSATSETNFDELNDVCNGKDEAALMNMIKEGKVYVLKYTNTYTMVDKKFGKCKIKADIGDGVYEVWVATEFIKPIK